MSRFITVPPQQSRSVMQESEANRLRGRYSNMDLLKQIQEAGIQSDNPKARAAHCCYVHLVGLIPDFGEKPHSREFETDAVERYFDESVLYQNVTELVDKREEYVVFEDNLGPTLEKMLRRGKKPSFALLREACSKFEKEALMQMHYDTSQQSHHFFCDKGIEPDEAQAYAFAIAFYTGTYSETLNRNAALFARNENRNASTNAELSKVDDRAAIIMYYLIKGLSHINFYWGVVSRCVQLKPEELEDYQPGVLITWLQFSSANKGRQAAAWFTGRNTVFIIYSLTGRRIKQFSNCAEDEDEVLFLPHSSFLVCHVEVIHRKHHIYLRQVELGLCKNVVMWVDDHIFDDWWENKEHMEKASTVGTRINVHFIPKSNTKAALNFLRSDFGQRLKTSDTFRIVTDMNRDNETPGDNAGVRLLYEVRKLGFNHRCLVFTGDAPAAKVKLAKMFSENTMQGIAITQHTYALENFVNFK